MEIKVSISGLKRVASTLKHARDVSDSISAALDLTAKSTSDIEEQANKAEIAHRLKQAGGKTGAINISLMWDNEGSQADLDIYVKCPQGTISYQSKHVGQGTLDIDMRENRQGACIENVYWESPDTGQFKISVHNFQCPQGFVMPFKVSINTKVPVTLMDEQGKSIHENFVGFKTFEGKAQKDQTVIVFGLCVEDEQKRREALIALKSQEVRNAERLNNNLDTFQETVKAKLVARRIHRHPPSFYL